MTDYWEIYSNDDNVPVIGDYEIPVSDAKAVGSPFIVVYDVPEESLFDVCKRDLEDQIGKKVLEGSATAGANAYRLGEDNFGDRERDVRACQLYVVQEDIIREVRKRQTASDLAKIAIDKFLT